MDTNENETENEVETKPAPAAEIVVPSTDDGKLCACERCPTDTNVASLPLTARAHQVDGVDAKGAAVKIEKMRPEKLGFCAKHGAGVEATGFKRTAEEWAALRGHLPHFHLGVPPADKPTKVMPKIWNPNFRLFQGAKNAHTWPVGMELTLADYDKAVHTAAHGHVFR